MEKQDEKDGLENYFLLSLSYKFYILLYEYTVVNNKE
jgi:hypothetical protein